MGGFTGSVCHDGILRRVCGVQRRGSARGALGIALRAVSAARRPIRLTQIASQASGSITSR